MKKERKQKKKTWQKYAKTVYMKQYFNIFNANLPTPQPFF